MERNRPIPDNEYELAVLTLINKGSEARPLLNATYDDIDRLSQTVDRFINCGYLNQEGERLFLSEMGKAYMKVLNAKLGRRGLYRYVLPDYSVRRKQMSFISTYIPQYMINRGGGFFSYSLVQGRSGESSGDNVFQIKHNK